MEVDTFLSNSKALYPLEALKMTDFLGILEVVTFIHFD